MLYSTTSMNGLKSKYEIVKMLGSGSYGHVALARCIQDHSKMAAFKIYEIRMLEKEKKITAFYRSNMILEKMNHPGIIKFYSYCTDKSLRYLLLMFEACPLGSLYKFLDRHQKKLNMLHKRYIIKEISSVLEYLGSMQVVHRDVKPSNIVISNQGTLKLIDFDEAITFNDKMLSEDEIKKVLEKKLGKEYVRGLSQQELKEIYKVELSRDRRNTYVFTPSYSSPEQRENHRVDYRSDIWSFGCIIYEIVTGRPFSNRYFLEAEEKEVLEKVMEKLMALPKDLPYEIPILLRNILELYPNRRISIKNLVASPFFKLTREETEQARRYILYMCNKQTKKKNYKAAKYEYELTPFLDRFPFMELPYIKLIVLVKNRYFYEPRWLTRGDNEFRISLDIDKEAYTIVYYPDVKNIRLNENMKAVELETNFGRFFYFKHINYNFNVRLCYSMIKCIDFF